jgi:DNA processing protein
MDEQIMRARTYLSRVAESPAPALVELVTKIGPVEAAQQVRARRVTTDLAREIRVGSATVRTNATLATARAAGADWSARNSPNGPTKLSPHSGRPGHPN